MPLRDLALSLMASISQAPSVRSDAHAATLGRSLMSPAGAGCDVPVDRRRRSRAPRWPNETIFPDREVVPQQTQPTVVLHQTAGFDHAGPHPQRDLSPIPQGRPSRHGKAGGKAMTEIVVAMLAFLSISVFLAHAFDAYRAG
jgi:hypothetical protein